MEKISEILVSKEPVPADYALALLYHVAMLLELEDNVARLSLDARITIVGDLSGQLSDLWAILNLNGLPSSQNRYVFNGGFTNSEGAGVFSREAPCECVLIIFALKLLYPKYVYFNRYNTSSETFPIHVCVSFFCAPTIFPFRMLNPFCAHRRGAAASRDMLSRGSFYRDCVLSYGLRAVDLFAEAFAALPLATLIEDKILVVHGGLPIDDNTNLKKLFSVDRFDQVPRQGGIMQELLWNQPKNQLIGSTPIKQKSASSGLVSHLFGPDVTRNFLQRCAFELVITSFALQQEGIASFHGGRILNVSSTSNLEGTAENCGCYLVLEPDFGNPSGPHRYIVSQFHSQPKARYAKFYERERIFRRAVLARLSLHISLNSKALKLHYDSLVRDRNGAARLLTLGELSAGLQSVLGLDISWGDVLSDLGVKQIEGRADYRQFLRCFQPQFPVLSALDTVDEEQNEQELNKDSGAYTLQKKSKKERLQELLYQLFFHHVELEALCRFVDFSGEGWMSVQDLESCMLGQLNVVAHSQFLLATSSPAKQTEHGKYTANLRMCAKH